MIVIGYQGIGKSTLTQTQKENFMLFERSKTPIYVDLESSNMWYIDENNERIRDTNWFITYTNMAKDLSSQGFCVFTSSHKQVRDALANSYEKVYVCYPAISLKDKWIERLQRRYDMSISPFDKEKNYKALMNAVDRYEENIQELIDSPFDKIELKTIEYNLGDLISRKFTIHS